MRIDKWLWAARFFRTRALAARACELGRIESNEHPAKASREVRVGDLLRVKTDSGEFHIQVLLLTQMRGPAAVAQTLYQETEASREARQRVTEERKALLSEGIIRETRPTGRQRRELDRFRGRL